MTSEGKRFRRGFLKEVAAGWISLIIGPSIYAFFRGSYFGSSTSKPHGPIKLGALEELKEGPAKTIGYGLDKIILVRTHPSTLVALSAVCTHLVCSVCFRETQSGGKIVCNCHDSVFALDGENRTGPAPSPLKAYKVEIKECGIKISDVEGD